MKRVINSAKYVRYNANASGNNVGDCVKRALSLAFDMDYREIAKILNKEAKTAGLEYNVPVVYRTVARQLGADKWVSAWKEGFTLDEFIDEHCQHGTYLIETGGNKASSTSNHIVCVIDGTLYDSWDSSDQYVKDYTSVNITQRKEMTDIQDHLNDLLAEFKEELAKDISKRVQAYKQKGAEWAQDTEITEISVRVDGYRLMSNTLFKIKSCPYRDHTKSYHIKIVAVLHPQDTVEEAQSIIHKVTPVRVYDRLYEIAKREATYKEMYDTSGSLDSEAYDWYMNRQTAKVFRSLPGWVQSNAKYFHVEQPGKYSNSYSLELKALPEDGEFFVDPPGTVIDFEARTSDQLKKMLNAYKTQGLEPNRDYSPYEAEEW